MPGTCSYCRTADSTNVFSFYGSIQNFKKFGTFLDVAFFSHSSLRNIMGLSDDVWRYQNKGPDFRKISGDNPFCCRNKKESSTVVIACLCQTPHFPRVAHAFNFSTQSIMLHCNTSSAATVAGNVGKSLFTSLLLSTLVSQIVSDSHIAMYSLRATSYAYIDTTLCKT